MKNRDRYNILFPKGRGLEEYLSVQEISNDVFKTDKLHISILAADFSTDISAKYRKELVAKWLKILPTLDNIKFLSLRVKVCQEFFEAVCKMKNLEYLTFWTSSVEDISSITKLKRLKRLDIDHFSKLEDIRPLKDLINLEILTVTNSMKITCYEVIGELTSLIGLSIQGDQIAPKNLRLKSLKPFANLKKLKHLDLTSTIVIDNSYHIILEMNSLQRFDITTIIEKPLRDKIKKLHNLNSGFFMDFDWDKNEF